MAKAKVVPTAARRPGRCAISKETQGPFIDTGRDIPRYGRVYLSLKWLEPMLRDNGVKNFIPEEEIESLQERVNKVEDLLSAQEETISNFHSLVDAVAPYLPDAEPEVREVTVVKTRKPTDEEVEDWIARFGAQHPAVTGARRPEPGSAEEWFSLYGKDGGKEKPEFVEADESEDVEVETEDTDGPPRIVTLYDQDVNLDSVLNQNVKDIEGYAHDKPESFQAALVRREYFLANKEGRTVRKGVLEPLGYWDEDENEPLIPLDDDEEEE